MGCNQSSENQWAHTSENAPMQGFQVRLLLQQILKQKLLLQQILKQFLARQQDKLKVIKLLISPLSRLSDKSH